jgi:hypothetical protein
MIASSRKGVKAVACELVGRDVIPDVACAHGLDQQLSNHLVNLVLGSSDVRVSMQQCRQLGVVTPSGSARKHSIGVEHRVQPLASVAGPVPHVSEVREVFSDLASVPRSQDRFDVREVFVERRPSNARILRDLRHRHRQQPASSDQRCCGVQDRLAYLAAVRLDGLGP